MHDQSRSLLQSTDDNILVQLVEELMKRDAQLNLVIKKEGLFRDVKLRDSLCCSDHEMVVFGIIQGSSKVESRIATQESQF